MAPPRKAATRGRTRRRVKKNVAIGQAHIKTGTLNGVRAIGGYILDRHGRRHALVMMVNHPEAAASAAANRSVSPMPMCATVATTGTPSRSDSALALT